MYRNDLQTRDKGGAIIAVIAVHAMLLLALLQISGRIDLTDPQEAMRVFDVSEEQPPPPEPPPPEERRAEAPQEQSGGAPPNFKSEATPIKRVFPRISLPVPVPLETSETPAQGIEATQGAADVGGAGTGAGGSGTGTGSGSGSGGGHAAGGAVQPPQLLTPVLRARDFPSQMLEAWPRGAQLFLRMRVDANGAVTQCIVDRGTGFPLIDSQVCRTAQARFRYRPALSAAGRPVAGWAGYRQTPPR